MGDSNIVDENDELSASAIDEGISVENSSDSFLSAQDEPDEVLTDDEPQIIDMDVVIYNQDYNEDINYGDSLQIFVVFSDAMTGDVNVTFNNVTYPGIVDDEEWFCVEITDILNPGNYTVSAVFINKEDNLYGSCNSSFIINKIKTSIDLVNIGEDFNIACVLKKSDGNPMGDTIVFYTINNGERLNTTTASDGTFNIVAYEDAYVYLSFEGDDVFESSNRGVSLISLKPIVLYVGQNTTETPDGSKQNPYPSLIDAWKYVDNLNISSIDTNITINFEDGEYVFDSSEIDNLIANSKNNKGFVLNEYMNITLQAINPGQVNFKFNCNQYLFDCKKFIELTYSGINFIFNNTGIFIGANNDNKGDLIFKNCSFINFTSGFNSFVSKSNYRILTDCYFDGNGVDDGIIISGIESLDLKFTKISYCSFYNIDGYTTSMYSNVLFKFSILNGVLEANYNWFGSNNRQVVPQQISGVIDASIYAVYNTEINYIGYNQFEVIGKLTWNDGTTEGIERLHDMPVYLSSPTGSFNDSNPILKDGTFRVIYTSDNSTNNITVRCDGEVKEFNFTNPFNFTDVIVKAEDVYYCEPVNVSIEIKDNINGTVTVNVDDNEYSTFNTTETNFIVQITSTLDLGNHTVEVVFYDAQNNLTGSNSTTFEVKKVENTIKVEVDDVVCGEFATVYVTASVCGNYTVDVNGSAVVVEVLTDGGRGSANTSALTVCGVYYANVTYSNPYQDVTIINSVFEVKKIEVNIDSVLNITAPKDATSASFTINLENATGNLTVFVNNKTYSKELVNGSATVDITDLPAGTYDAIVTYSGDDKFASVSKNTNVTIKEAVKPVNPSNDSKKPANSNKVTKVASKIIAKNKKFKAKKKVKKYTITLKAGKKPIKKVQVTLKVKGKTYKAKTNAKGKATFKIKNLKKKGKYKAVIKFKGNKNYKASTKKVKITVKK